MNRLKIEFSNEGYIYFKTEEKSIGKAFNHWRKACDNAGIDIDNIVITEAVLLDANGDVLGIV